MKALDTNVVIRFLVCDDAAMTARARCVFEQAKEAGEPLVISNLALLEALWVLGSAYGFSREAILDAIDGLHALPFVRFESSGLVHGFLRRGRTSTLDLADLLIGVQAKSTGAAVTLTFDKKAARRSDLFEDIA